MAFSVMLLTSISMGVLLISSIVFFMTFRFHRTHLHLSLFVLSVLGLLINFFEGTTIYYGDILQEYSTAVFFNRGLEWMITLFLGVIPLYISGVFEAAELKKPSFLSPLQWSGLAIAVVILIASLVFPDLFKSTTVFRESALSSGIGMGRGLPGTILLVRDAFLFLYIMVGVISFVHINLKAKTRHLFLISMSGVIFLPIIAGIDDILYNYRGSNFLFPDLVYPRFIPALSIFILISVGVAFFQYITEAQQVQIAHKKLKDSQDKLVYLALFDKLTGLPNQKAFFERLDAEIANSRRSVELNAVLLVDIDNFRAFNDTYGFGTGDQIIYQVASILQHLTRESDFLARLNGDELALIITNLEHPTQAALVAQKLLGISSEKITIGEKSFFTTISIGIALFPGDSQDRTDLLRMADEALNEAKKDKNTFQFYTPTTNMEAHNKLSILNELRKAVDQSSFELYYQPIIGQNGRIQGAEALLRWKMEDGNYMPPDIFIPIAESTGLIQGLGLWVLEQAIEHTRKIKTVCDELFISINLSAKQLRNPLLPGVVMEILSHHNLTPLDIHLEITETALMENHARLIEILNDFQERELHLAIDDFGVGYSSLSYLRSLPVKTLKIDKTFVRNISMDLKDKAIVKSVVELAKGLGLKIIAEGAETNLQVQHLWDLGCDLIQGYFFAKPMPFPEFLTYVEENLKRT